MNSSFGSKSDLHNKSLIEKSKLDGSIMLDKKRNLKQSRENVSKNQNRHLVNFIINLSLDDENEKQNRCFET